MNAAQFWRDIKAIAEEATKRMAPFRAKATSVTSEGIQIQTYDSREPTGERYAKLRGPKIKPNQEVAVMPYGGSYLVLGAVGGDDVLEVLSASNSGTEVLSTTSTTTFVNALTKSVQLDAGTWELNAVASLNLRHDANGGAAVGFSINGNVVSNQTSAVTSTGYVTITTTYSGEVTSTGPVELGVKFRSNTAGTTTARNASFFVTARRVA